VNYYVTATVGKRGSVVLDHLDRLDRAARLRDLQTFGVRLRSATGLGDVDAEAVVERVLAKRRVNDRLSTSTDRADAP
jgi:hypothetical protein